MFGRILFPLLFIFIGMSVFAQTYKVHGKITTNKMEALAFVTVQVKGVAASTISKEDGSYELSLEPGKYDVIFSMIGYQPQALTIIVTANYLQNIIMEEEEASLDEVVVRVKARDRAEELVKSVIKNKDNILAASGPYSVKVYIKATQQDSATITKKIKGDAEHAIKEQNDIAKMAMAEISLKLDYESDQRLKEERIGVKKNNNTDGLYYLTTLEGNFNFYNNLIKVPSISSIPFLSPLSYSGLLAYKFKTLKIQKVGNHRIYTISVKPRALSNATVEGEMTISDSAWVVLNTRFRFPQYHLVEYDFFEVEQTYDYVQNKAWLLTRQEFTYYSKGNKNMLSGNTVVTFKDYELNKQFRKNYFGLEVSSTAQEAYQKDSTFWQTVRTEPLTERELKFIRHKDSMFRLMNSEHYLDSMERETNKITWKKVAFTGQGFYDRRKERRWELPSVVALVDPFAYGGLRIKPSIYYSDVTAYKKHISVHADLSYGFRNSDINGSVGIRKLYDPFRNGIYSFSAGRNFDQIYSGDAWINQLKRSNFYLNNMLGGSHQIELVNGLTFFTEMEVALRRSVSNYKTGKIVDSVLGDYLDNNQAVPFDPYNAVYGKFEIWYVPYQRYMREPRQKIFLGSKWPTFYVSWRKGVPNILNSKVDFDYLEFGIRQEVKLGIMGTSRYKIRTGEFLNKKDLRLVDYRFQRRGDPILFSNPDDAFQALDSTFPLFNRYFDGHFVHEFNGALLNKIPLLKKLQLREIGGAGFLIAPERNLRYVELFAGIERIFRWPFDQQAKFKLGAYVVGSAANHSNNPLQFKVGITTWNKRRNKWN